MSLAIKNALLGLAITIGCWGCIQHANSELNIKELSTNFFERYANRTDWQGFLDQYSDSIHFQDVIFRLNFNGKEDFKNFYNWPDTNFRKHPAYPKTLVLQDLAVTDTSAVGRGYFTPFYYKGVLYDQGVNMRFTMWLYFDDNGKITRHIDYIEYPPVFLKSAAERLMEEEKNSD